MAGLVQKSLRNVLKDVIPKTGIQKSLFSLGSGLRRSDAGLAMLRVVRWWRDLGFCTHVNNPEFVRISRHLHLRRRLAPGRQCLNACIPCADVLVSFKRQAGGCSVMQVRRHRKVGQRKAAVYQVLLLRKMRVQ